MMNKKTLTVSYSLMLAGLLAAAPTTMFAANPEMEAAAAAPQSKGISGQVLDENGNPIIGATVRVSGTKVATVTDVNGNFSMPDVAVGTKIQVSYVGYLTRDLTAKVAHGVIKLDPDNNMLDETIVIGYGVQKKSNVTGAISSIKADDLKNNVNTNAAQSLQGKVSGVQVVNSSGAPGSAPTIRIRGYASNGKSDPLYIVDGLKVDDIAYLDPSSITSMEILKDAASAAIYGAEAGNGVVLITTNGGQKGKTKITLDASWSWQSLAHKVDVMNASQYKQFMTEANAGSEGGNPFLDRYNKYYANLQDVNTDWQDKMYETGTMQKYNIGAQGGNDRGKFYLNLGYMKNNGMLVGENDYYKRVTGQINASYKIRKWLEVSTNNTLAYIRNHGVTESNVQYGFMKGILTADPLTPISYTSLSQAPENYQTAIANGLAVPYKNGTYYALSPFGTNPMRDLVISNPENSDSNSSNRYFINGSTSLNFTPFKNFVFTSRLGYTLGSYVEKSYTPAQWTDLTSPEANNQDPSISSQQVSTRYYQWENFANYTLETNIGNWGIMAGMSYSDKTRDYTTASSNQLSSYNDNFLYLDYSTTGADDKVSGHTEHIRKIAYYGRLSWDWKGRYNAQFNFRADSYDSAYLSLNHNWGYFPSASVGWTFSEEDFMKNITEKGVFTYGKFRASYGVNGSVANLGNYMYASTVQTGSLNTFMNFNLAPITYYMNNTLYQGMYPSTKLANSNLQWEESKQFDLGLDLRWFKGRLITTFDYYSKNTTGMLVSSAPLLTTGCRTVTQNLGKINNSGFEAEVSWRDRIGKDFRYEIKGNIATVHNKVEEFKGQGTRISGSQIQGADTETYFEEGYPIWYIRGYKIDHIDSETGMAVYQDTNNDGEVTDADRTNLGSAVPNFTYGFTINLGYKNFDLSVYGAGQSGNKLVYAMLSGNSKYENRPTFLTEGRWTKAGDVATMPSANQQINDTRFYNSDAFVRDASFFKIKQIQLGYTFPKSWLKKIFVEDLRLYVSLENFFTFTSYEGPDPEANALSNSTGYTASSMALDYGAYPSAKTVSVGFNLGF